MVELSEFTTYLKRRSRPNTVSAYVAVLSHWSSWLGDREPSQDTAQEFIDYLEESGKASNTIVLAANAIRRYFRWLRQPITLDCPSIYLGEPKYLTKEQLFQLIKSCRVPLERAMVICLFDTACRISELLNLTTEDIDWENSLITVTRKGGRRAQVNISEKGVTALKEWLESRESKSRRVFMDYEYQDIYQVLGDLGKRAKVDFRPHMLRHSRAIEMLEQGAPLNVVQQHLGHTNIGTTANIYCRWRPVDLKDKIPAW